jgi:hypothetical protein
MFGDIKRRLCVAWFLGRVRNVLAEHAQLSRGERRDFYYRVEDGRVVFQEIPALIQVQNLNNWILINSDTFDQLRRALLYWGSWEPSPSLD